MTLSHPHDDADVIEFPREQILGDYTYPWAIRNRILGTRMCNILHALSRAYRLRSADS